MTYKLNSANKHLSITALQIYQQHSSQYWDILYLYFNQSIHSVHVTRISIWL